MPPRSSGVRVSPIRSDRDLEKALREIDALMDAARPGSEEEDRLEILSTLVDVLLSIHLWKVASSPTGFPQGVISHLCREIAGSAREPSRKSGCIASST